MIQWPELPRREIVTLETLCDAVGSTTTSPWITLDQSTFDGFADVTGDDATIHTSPEFAARTRFGGTIAHGLLVLSLLPRALRWAMPQIAGARTGINYGFDSVRFLTPVPCGARVRVHFTLLAVEPRPGNLWVIRHDVVVELEGSDKPALRANWMIGRWMDRNG